MTIEFDPVERGLTLAHRGLDMADAGRIFDGRLTRHLDADVLERFRADGPGWQTRINAELRAAAGP